MLLLKPVIHHLKKLPSHLHGTPTNGRLYTTRNTTPMPATPEEPRSAPKLKPVVPLPLVKRPDNPLEVHEGAASPTVHFNTPSGGPGPNIPGGGGSSTVTGSRVLDALLTTAVGLGAGK